MPQGAYFFSSDIQFTTTVSDGLGMSTAGWRGARMRWPSGETAFV